MRRPTRPAGRGFTLIELLVVIMIIGILLSFILAASMAGAREAEIRATQGLLVKLDHAMTDRIDAFSQLRHDPNQRHSWMAGVWNPSIPVDPQYLPTQLHKLPDIKVAQRAQVIATYEAYRAEFPDVFLVQDPASFNYPVNFGMRSTNATNPNSTSASDYVYPMGLGTTSGSTGIFGASYAAAAGFYKNVGKNVLNKQPQSGYDPRGYDGVDNNGNGMIDEYAEGNLSGNGAAVQTALGNHTHKTARSEMLYAMLVESQGPYGSSLDRDDFSTREIGDTDNDGLPEFLDAWGEPIYYFRWPVLYPSDVQRGMPFNGSAYSAPYQSIFETRETNTLDPNNQLTSPSWWSGSVNTSHPWPGGDTTLSGGVIFFQRFFHQITEPLTNSGGTGTFWDRGASGSTLLQRRQFLTRPLIVSSGPDRQLGLPLADLNAISSFKTDTQLWYLQLEGQAAIAPLSGTRTTSPNNYGSPDPSLIGTVGQAGPPGAADFYDRGQDDISNQSLQTAAGATP